MKRWTPLLLLALAACQPDRSQPESKELPRAIEAVLIVHWQEAGPDFSREYPTMDRCEAARSVILNDAAARVSEALRAVSNAQPRISEPRPVPICIPV